VDPAALIPIMKIRSHVARLGGPFTGACLQLRQRPARCRSRGRAGRRHIDHVSLVPLAILRKLGNDGGLEHCHFRTGQDRPLIIIDRAQPTHQGFPGAHWCRPWCSAWPRAPPDSPRHRLWTVNGETRRKFVSLFQTRPANMRAANLLRSSNPTEEASRARLLAPGHSVSERRRGLPFPRRRRVSR